ncbi:MAG: amidohydrolase family protein [Limnochordia bacterium]
MIFDVNAWLGAWPFRRLRDNEPEALAARLQRLGISAAAVSQIDAIFYRNVQSANERLVAAVQPYKDMLIPLATINPTYVHWERDLQECHEQLGMRGVRLFPEYHDYLIDGPLARQVVEACAARSLPVQIPMRIEDYRGRHRVDPGRAGVELARIANLIAAVPQATIMVTNARGIVNSPLWQRAELRAANWYVDLSLAEVHYQLHRDLRYSRDLGMFIEQGGADHLLFGSHVPFSYLGSALVKLATLPVSPETLENISYHYAASIFGLSC